MYLSRLVLQYLSAVLAASCCLHGIGWFCIDLRYSVATVLLRTALIIVFSFSFCTSYPFCLHCIDAAVILEL